MRFLIAGLGAIGQRHARNLRTLYGGDVELLAYRQRRLSRVVTDAMQSNNERDVESELGITAFLDLDAALDAGPDAVFVCTPSSQHIHIAQRAAAAGCHLFIEKPVSHSLDGLEQLRNTVRTKGLTAVIGCQWRYHPCIASLRGLLQEGSLGKVVGVDIEYSEYLPDWHPYEDYRQSYAARDELGGGVVLTQIHDYDLAWWLFGQPRAVRATGGHLSELEIDVEDTVDASLDTEQGFVRVRQSFASRVRRRMITVSGERHSATVDLLDAHLSTDGMSGVSVSFAGYPRNQMFLDEIRRFIACLEGHAQPDVPLDDGIAVLRVALAVRESIRSGSEVKLSWAS